MKNNLCQVISATKELAKASLDADEAYANWITKLEDVKRLAEKLQNLIDKQMQLPSISLEGLELDG